MNRTRLGAALAALLFFTVPVLAEDSTGVAKAPYLNDITQAKAEAAENGIDALVYFFSPT